MVVFKIIYGARQHKQYLEHFFNLNLFQIFIFYFSWIFSFLKSIYLTRNLGLKTPDSWNCVLVITLLYWSVYAQYQGVCHSHCISSTNKTHRRCFFSLSDSLQDLCVLWQIQSILNAWLKAKKKKDCHIIKSVLMLFITAYFVPSHHKIFIALHIITNFSSVGQTI